MCIWQRFMWLSCRNISESICYQNKIERVLASVLYHFMFRTNEFNFCKRKEELHRKLIFSIYSLIKIINKKNVWQTFVSFIYYFFCIFNINTNSSRTKTDTLTGLTSRLFVWERYIRSITKFSKKLAFKNA